jgi:hypothetical protein
MKLDATPIVRPSIGRSDQDRGGLVAILGLRANVSDGFIQENRDPLRLLFAGGGVDLNPLVRLHPLTQHGGSAIDQDPAGFNPGIGFAPRRQALIG